MNKAASTSDLACQKYMSSLKPTSDYLESKHGLMTIDSRLTKRLNNASGYTLREGIQSTNDSMVQEENTRNDGRMAVSSLS